MSAPKPRIRVVSSGTGQAWFQWYCPCEEEGLPPGYVRAPRVVNFSHADALEQAIQHSRTHTAERIADQLDRNALARRVDSIAAIDAAHRETDYSVYQQGVAMGLERASRLVREHLAGRAS